MLNGKIVCFLLIFRGVVVENKIRPQTNSVSTHLVDDTRHGITGKKNKFDLGRSEFNFRCKHKCSKERVPFHVRNDLGQVRFIDLGANNSATDDQMEAPTPKFSILNLLTGEEEEESSTDKDSSDYGNDETVKDGEDEDEEDDDDGGEEEEDDDDSMNFFVDDDEEVNSNKHKDGNEEGFLKQYHRHGFRMHNLVFPLLLAYKLKFFTIIPLLLGALVLLVGTTGVAGFFFALFAAALGIHVKSNHHHHHH